MGMPVELNFHSGQKIISIAQAAQEMGNSGSPRNLQDKSLDRPGAAPGGGTPAASMARNPWWNQKA